MQKKNKKNIAKSDISIDLSMGKRVMEIRKLHNLTQKEFAEKIDIKQPTLSDIERGYMGVSIRVMVCISSVFNIDLNWLLYGKNNPYRKTDDTEINVGEISKKNTEAEANIIKDYNIGNFDNNSVISRELDLMIINNTMSIKTLLLPTLKSLLNLLLKDEKENKAYREGEEYLNSALLNNGIVDIDINIEYKIQLIKRINSSITLLLFEITTIAKTLENTK